MDEGFDATASSTNARGNRTIRVWSSASAPAAFNASKAVSEYTAIPPRANTSKAASATCFSPASPSGRYSREGRPNCSCFAVLILWSSVFVSCPEKDSAAPAAPVREETTRPSPRDEPPGGAG